METISILLIAIANVIQAHEAYRKVFISCHGLEVLIGFFNAFLNLKVNDKDGKLQKSVNFVISSVLIYKIFDYELVREAMPFAL